MKILFLAIVLLFLFVLCLVTEKNNIFTPQMLFVVGFLCAVLYCFAYLKRFDFNLDNSTMFVLVFGISLFVFVSLFIKGLYDVIKINCMSGKSCSVDTGFYIKDKKIQIELWKMLVIIALQAISIILFTSFLIKANGGSDLMSAIQFFRNTNTFTEKTIDTPALISVLRLFSIGMADIFLYLIAHQIIYKYRHNTIYIMIGIGLSIISSMLGGARTGFIGMVFNFFLFLYYIYKDKYNWRRSLSVKTIIKILSAMAVLLVAFYIYAVHMRGTSKSFGDYIFVYLSAPIYNLNKFMQKGQFGSSIANNQTFGIGRQYLAKRLGIAGWGTKLDIPFIEEKGFSFGNVYTIFYMFLYDGGYVALVIFTVLMAVLSQVLYQFVRRVKSWYYRINIPLIVYTKVAYAILFSFFSNRFYEAITDIAFYRGLIITIVVSWFMLSFRDDIYYDYGDNKNYIVSRKYKFFNKVYTINSK